MKIAIAGTGYVGVSNSMLLAQHNEVIAVDIIEEKVNLLNNKKSPISDVEIEDFLLNKNLNFLNKKVIHDPPRMYKRKRSQHGHYLVSLTLIRDRMQFAP